MIFDSGTFDVDGFYDTPLFWTLDSIIELTQSQTFSLESTFSGTQKKPFALDIRIESPKWQFALDTILVLQRDSPRFQESIINAMMWSYGRAIEKLSESIDLMGNSLKLPDAPIEDLDLYWSKLLGIKRRTGEPDEDFRMRLATQLSILASSGTKAELEAVINRILNMPNAARIDTYWPAEIWITWASTYAARVAKSKYGALKEALDSATIAGVSWSTSFPFADWQMDTKLIGPQTVPFKLGANLAGSRWWPWRVTVDLLNIGIQYWPMDLNLEDRHRSIWRADLHMWAENTKAFLLGGVLIAKYSHIWQMDQIIEGRPTKTQQIDMIAEAKNFNIFRTDMLAEKGRRGFFMLDCELVAA